MKKILLGLAALVSLTVGGMYFTRKFPQSNVSAPSPTQNVLGATPFPGGDIIATPAIAADRVSLIPNFKNSKTSEELQKSNGCTFLVNGGFYTKEEKPVGLFTSNGETIRGAHESELFNGFLSINQLGVPRITRQLPRDPLPTAIQLGPMLIENASPIRLSIRNDSEERRMAVLVTGSNELIFLMIQNSRLAVLPERISSWARAMNVNVADAINLDGGSASVFRGPDIVLPEISPIGSAFCIK